MPIDHSHHTLRKTKANHRTNQTQPCWRCGRPIDYTADSTRHPDAYTLGHRHPISTHPHLALDPANLAPEHRSCNLTAGPTNTNSRGQQSRQW